MKHQFNNFSWLRESQQEPEEEQIAWLRAKQIFNEQINMSSGALPAEGHNIDLVGMERRLSAN
jgi:hypothetical protein